MGWSGASVGEKIGAVGQTAVAAGLLAAPVAGAAIGAKKLIEGGSAMTQVERAQEERRKRKEQGGP